MFVNKTAIVYDNDDNFINGIEGLSKPLFGVLPEINNLLGSYFGKNGGNKCKKT
jgi:hypothetical protein